jgi:hypothetical protein
MTKRDNHYEAAFEAWLQLRRVPYVAVDEAKRSQLGNSTLKSLDFIVSPVGVPQRFLVDVKGRKFGTGELGQSWKNWTTRDDLASLARWQELFGPPFIAVLVFAYEIVGEVAPLAQPQLFAYRKKLYAFVAIRLDHYTSAARVISPRWGTLSMPAARFREMACPVESFLHAGVPSAARMFDRPATAPLPIDLSLPERRSADELGGCEIY